MHVNKTAVIANGVIITEIIPKTLLSFRVLVFVALNQPIFYHPI